MSDNKMFNITFNGRNYEIPKASAKFQDGYAVIEKTIKSSAKEGCLGYWYDYDLNLKGVIDEDFDTVLEFKGWYSDIQLFPEGNVIVKVRFSGGDGEQSYTRYENHHYKIDGKYSSKVTKLESWEYNRINETTIKVKNNVFGSGFEALYDVVKGKFISDKFSVIGKFEQKNESCSDKLAKATTRLFYNDGTQNVCEVFCYIDELGTIRTSIYNPHTDSMIDTTSEDFDYQQTIETIKKDISEESRKKSNAENKLFNTIRL